ncbi:MAG: hypothetical protein ACM3SR_06435 [Ignavibacteriales bacterium]
MKSIKKPPRNFNPRKKPFRRAPRQVKPDFQSRPLSFFETQDDCSSGEISFNEWNPLYEHSCFDYAGDADDCDLLNQHLHHFIQLRFQPEAALSTREAAKGEFNGNNKR